jgi:Co/Zn/Cd efflux system component
MRHEQLTAAAIELAAIAGEMLQRIKVAASARPLIEKAFTMLGERQPDRLKQRRHAFSINGREPAAAFIRWSISPAMMASSIAAAVSC